MSTKTLDIPNQAVLISLVYTAIRENIPFGAHWSQKERKWTLAIPADKYGAYLKTRNEIMAETPMENNA